MIVRWSIKKFEVVFIQTYILAMTRCLNAFDGHDTGSGLAKGEVCKSIILSSADNWQFKLNKVVKDTRSD